MRLRPHREATKTRKEATYQHLMRHSVCQLLALIFVIISSCISRASLEVSLTWGIATRMRSLLKVESRNLNKIFFSRTSDDGLTQCCWHVTRGVSWQLPGNEASSMRKYGWHRYFAWQAIVTTKKFRWSYGNFIFMRNFPLALAWEGWNHYKEPLWYAT